MASSTEICGFVCTRANVPENCSWDEAQYMHDYYQPYLLLDHEGLLAIPSTDPLWLEVSFEDFSKYYSIYLMGINPVAAYNEVHNER